MRAEIEYIVRGLRWRLPVLDWWKLRSEEGKMAVTGIAFCNARCRGGGGE